MMMSSLLSLYEELFQQGKINPNWRNISYGIIKEVSDDILINFFSKNVDELLNEKYVGLEQTNNKITEILYKNSEIDLGIYKKLTEHLDFKFDEIFEDFPLERIEILVENKCLEINRSTVEELIDRIETKRDEENEINDFSAGLVLIKLFYNKADPNANVNNVEYFIDHVLKENFKEDIKLSLVAEYYSQISDDNKNIAVEILFKDEDSKINYAIKNKIIDTQRFVLGNLSSLKNAQYDVGNNRNSIFTNLFSKDKIYPNWENLIEYTGCNRKSDSVLSNFMNRNTSLLINDTLDEDQKDFIEQFILENKLLDDDVYIQLVDKMNLEIFESINVDLSWKKIHYLSDKKLLSLNCIELIYQKRDKDDMDVGVGQAEKIIFSIIAIHSERGDLEAHEIWQYLNHKNTPQNKLITKLLSSEINDISKELVFQQVIKSYKNSQMIEEFSLLYPIKKVDIIRLANLLENDADRLQLLIYYYKVCDKEDLITIFGYFKDEKYQHLAPGWDKRPKLESNENHISILEKMVADGYLSEKSLDNKGGEFRIRKLIS